jgi:hypothetical protein
MPGAPRALREQGRRSFGFLLSVFLAGCLKCESDDRALDYERCRATCSLHPPLEGEGRER